MASRPTRASATQPPRAAIITSNFWPEESGIGQVTTEFAEFLAEQGIQVRVATARPYYPAWRIYPGYRGLTGGRTQHRRNLVIYRAWHYTTPNPSALQRIAHELTLTLCSLPNMFRAIRGSDVAFVVSPDLFHAFAASAMARLLGVKCALMVQDIQPDAAVELGMLHKRSVILTARWIAELTYRFADEIYTLTEGMRRRLLPHAKPQTEIKILPNTVDVREMNVPEERENLFRSQFVREGMFAVVHSGNMGEKQNLNLLLDTAAELRNHGDIHFFVFGDGAVKADFLNRIQLLDLKNVSHFPFQSREMFKHTTVGADAILISQLPEALDIFFPSKLVTALGAGAMIIVACAGESEPARLIAASQAGLWVAPSDAPALARVILEIKSGKVDSRSYRVRAKDYARRFFDRTTVYIPVVNMLRSFAQIPKQE